MALRTGRGALAGAVAEPSGFRTAVVPDGPGVVVVVVVLPGGPAPPVWAMAGTAPASEATSSSPASPSFLPLPCVSDRKAVLLRRPTGLADGLALKEPAL